MPATMRTFVACPVRCPRKLEQVLDRLGQMGSAVRAVRADQIHLTLKFLGDTSPQQTSEVTQLLARVSEGVASVEVVLKGLGVFPRPERPNVVWVGMEPAGVLCELADRVNEALAALGFPPEQRRFVPHVTVARVKARPPQELWELLRSSGESEFGTVLIDRIVYYQSQLAPGGPQYTVLCAHDLSGG